MTTAPAPAPIAAITARRLPPPGRECPAGGSPCPPDPAGGRSLTVVAATPAAAPGGTLLNPAWLGPGTPTCWAPVLCPYAASPNAPRSASANSRQLWYRSPGALLSARPSTASAACGVPCSRDDSGGGGVDMCAQMTAVGKSRWNGAAPVSSSNAAQARPYWSARPSSAAPWICSGEQ